MYGYKIIYHCSDFDKPQEFICTSKSLLTAINYAKKFIEFNQKNNLGAFYELITVVENV
tara:strand:+ start:538 stop:714 length:177 start_codon:yes stop_codon:yes gene_type:complete